MKVLIHTCPQRMWYVEAFLAPELERQGADEVEIWNDAERKGNLRACMEAFAACGRRRSLGLRPSGGGGPLHRLRRSPSPFRGGKGGRDLAHPGRRAAVPGFCGALPGT